MKFNLEIPIIVNRVRIEGPKAAREVDLIFDTGARHTSLSWELLEEIGYSPAKVKEKVSVITANGIVNAPFLRVKEISVRNLAVKHCSVICHSIPDMAEVEGLLGLSFMEKFKITLDFKKRELEII